MDFSERVNLRKINIHRFFFCHVSLGALDENENFQTLKQGYTEMKCILC